MKRILVLDDDRLTRNLLRFILEKRQFDVELFADEQELIESGALLQSHLLLLDINLKKGKGTEVLRNIKSSKKYGYLPVIMITGEKEDAYIEECFREGAFDYITKPISETALTSRVEAALKHYQKFDHLKEEMLGLQSQSRNLNTQNQKFEKKIQDLELYQKELSETTQHLATATWRERKSKEELNIALGELEIAKSIAEESNKKIIASINYAKKIQGAFLPTDANLTSLFPHHFILYKPKDIVSGDFYWCWNNDRYKIIGVFDCTGHGVPGAFMSLIGMTILKDIVQMQGIYQIDNILEKMNFGIAQILNQESNENKDGLDAAVICIDNQKNTLQFCGAHNPLLYFKNDEPNLIKGDKVSIGGNRVSRANSLVLHELSLTGITEIYLFSDGLQDQFGGKENKKLGIKNIINFLEMIHAQPMDQQRQQLDDLLYKWMHAQDHKEAQIDDISFMGIRLS